MVPIADWLAFIEAAKAQKTGPALDAAAIDGFLARWSRALFPERPDKAEAHRKELVAALASRREIRLLARNNVMLTALAVVHWNDKRLPEQRAELYESILRWLLEAREQRPGREKAQPCRPGPRRRSARGAGARPRPLRLPSGRPAVRAMP